MAKYTKTHAVWRLFEPDLFKRYRSYEEPLALTDEKSGYISRDRARGVAID